MSKHNIKETRRQRLIVFIERFDGAGVAKNKAAAEQLGISTNYLSQLKMGYKPETKTGRPITEDTARDFETNAGLPHRWFDNAESAVNVDNLDARQREQLRQFANILRDPPEPK